MFSTGVLRNLNNIYAGTDAHDWDGFGVFGVSMVIVVAAWFAATPFTLRHPRIVQRIGYALIGPIAAILGTQTTLAASGVLNLLVCLSVLLVPSVRAIRMTAPVLLDP